MGGDGWNILLGLLLTALLYLALPIVAIVLALKYLRRPKNSTRE